MDLEISKEETLEQIVNDQREEIEQLKVDRAQLRVAVRKLTEANKGADENASQESQD